MSFNGKTISADGYEDFRFVIDNKDDNWKVLQGLSWTAPYHEDPTGDGRKAKWKGTPSSCSLSNSHRLLSNRIHEILHNLL